MEPFKIQDIDGTQYAESLTRRLSVITGLLKAYPDLIVREYNSKEIFFYSKSVNEKVQEVTFSSLQLNYGGTYKHLAHTKFLHDLDGEIVEILPEVGTIPLFEYTMANDNNGSPASIHYYNFEESFKKMKTPKLIAGKCRLYIITELGKLATNNVKTNHFWMPESIKKLMPFT